MILTRLLSFILTASLCKAICRTGNGLRDRPRGPTSLMAEQDCAPAALRSPCSGCSVAFRVSLMPLPILRKCPQNETSAS